MTGLDRHDRGPELDPLGRLPHERDRGEGVEVAGIWGTQIDVKPSLLGRLRRRRRAAPPCGDTALSPGRASGRSASSVSFRPQSAFPRHPSGYRRLLAHSILILREYNFHGESRRAAGRERTGLASARGLEEPERRARPARSSAFRGLLDAAFALIDERGTTEFTIQEVVDRSKQSLRGFYQYFDGKDELLFALLEESIRESLEDLRAAVESESKPLERLRAFTIRLHEWCEPLGTRRKRGAHNRVPISEFSLQLALKDPERLAAVMAPISRMLIELLKAAVAAGSLR